MIRLSVKLFLLLFLFCSGGSRDIAGTISETDSGCAVAGIVHDGTGAAVRGARAILHDQRHLSPGGASCRTVSPQPDTAETDSAGAFVFDSVAAGTYLIEVCSSDSLGVILPVTITGDDTLISRQGVVRLTGSITGTVDASVAGSGGQLSVVVREIGRTVPVDSAGCFTIGKLPEWNYRLGIIRDTTLLTVAGDTAAIPVASGAMTAVAGLGSKSGFTITDTSIVFDEIPFNTDSGIGGSVVFLESDSSLNVRLLVGRKDGYHRADIRISKWMPEEAGMVTSNLLAHLTDENSALLAYGNDSLVRRYRLIPEISYLFYRVSGDTARFSGNIVLAGIPDRSSGNPVRIAGSFRADIGPPGDATWDCNFGDTICNCWFIVR